MESEEENAAERYHREQEFEEAFHRNLPYLNSIEIGAKVNRHGRPPI
jgi:hypothetical protein